MKRLVLTAIATGVVAGGLFGALVASGAVGGGPAPAGPTPDPEVAAQKLALETAEAEHQATADAGYHAPKHPDDPVPTPLASCPLDFAGAQNEVLTGAVYQTPPGERDLFSTFNVLQEARAFKTDDGRIYSFYFGDVIGDHEQWMLVSWRGVKDPCAEGADDPLVMHKLPVRASDAKLTRIDTSMLYFELADGRSGAFDYIKGTFTTIQ